MLLRQTNHFLDRSITSGLAVLVISSTSVAQVLLYALVNKPPVTVLHLDSIFTKCPSISLLYSSIGYNVLSADTFGLDLFGSSSEKSRKSTAFLLVWHVLYLVDR